MRKHHEKKSVKHSHKRPSRSGFWDSPKLSPTNLTQWILTIIVILIFYLFAPYDQYVRRKLFSLAAIVAFIALGIGILLLVQTKRYGYKGRDKILFSIVGWSIIGIPVLSIAHNLLYALEAVSEGYIFAPVFTILHVTAFLLSVIGCPIALIISSIWILGRCRRKRAAKQKD